MTARSEHQMDDLTGMVVLVTGASSGIGAETAKLIGERGASVIAQFASNRSGAEAATAAIPFQRKLLIEADFARDGVESLWSDAVQRYGHVDSFVNNAAVMPEAGLHADDTTWLEAWEGALDINVVQASNLMRRAALHFVGRGSGTIITLSSWVAQRGAANPNLIAYSASKAAITAATKTIARSFALDGVLAYCVAPGPVATEMTRRSAASQGGEAAVVGGLAMREMIPTHEIAELVAFLCTGRARHLSGATLDVNGATYIR